MASWLLKQVGAVDNRSEGAKLIHRLHTAQRIDDRQDAATAFTELAAAQPLRLKLDGGLSLFATLAADDDTGIAKSALEALANLLEVDSKPPLEAARVAAVHNASLFVGADPPLLPSIMGALELTDMHVRFHAIQFLMKLLALEPSRTHEVILAHPAAVGSVLTLLDDQREIVRAEAIQLVLQMARGAPAGLLNLLAFQGAFDRLHSIVASELEAASGDEGAAAAAEATLRDALDMVGALLESNAPVRALFCESALPALLVGLLRLPSSHRKVEAERAALAAGVLRRLLASESSPLARDCVLRLGALDVLMDLPTSPSTATDGSLRAHALAALALLVRGDGPAGAQLAAARVMRRDGDVMLSEPFLPRLFDVALRSTPPYQVGALEVLRGLCRERPSLQLALSAALAEASDETAADADDGAGSDEAAAATERNDLGLNALDALVAPTAVSTTSRASPTRSWLAAGVLGALLQANPDVKLLLLPSGSSGSPAPRGTSQRLASALVAALCDPSSSPLTQVALLRLHLVWLSECPEAAAAFVAMTPNLPALVDALGAAAVATPGAVDVHVAGHAAALLGTCLCLANGGADDGSEPPPRSLAAVRGALLQMVVRRIGLRSYAAAWEGMRYARAYAAAASFDADRAGEEPAPPGWAHCVLIYDESSYELLERVHERVNATLLECYAGEGPPPTVALPRTTHAELAAGGGSEAEGGTSRALTSLGEPDPIIESFKQLIQKQDADNAALEAELQGARAQAAAVRAQLHVVSASSIAPAGLEPLHVELRMLEAAGAALEAVRGEKERALAELGELQRGYAEVTAALADRESELTRARAELELAGSSAGGADEEGAYEEGRVRGDAETTHDRAADADALLSARSEVQALQLRLTMLQAHADGMAQDAAASAEREELAVAALAGAEEARRAAEEAAEAAARRASEAEAKAAEVEERAAADAAESARDEAESAVEAAVAAAAASAADAESARSEVDELRQEVARLVKALAADPAPTDGALLDAPLDAPLVRAEAEELRAQLAQLREEHEELLICLAEQDDVSQELKRQLAAAAGPTTPLTVAGAGPGRDVGAALF